MLEKLIPGTVIYGRSNVFWWRKATIVGVDLTRTIVPSDTVVFIIQEVWEAPYKPEYSYLTLSGIMADINDGLIRLDRRFEPDE